MMTENIILDKHCNEYTGRRDIIVGPLFRFTEATWVFYKGSHMAVVVVRRLISTAKGSALRQCHTRRQYYSILSHVSKALVKDWRIRNLLASQRSLCCSAMDNRGNSLNAKDVSQMIPPLCSNAYKGQSGKIAVIGGCKEYTGAPYFAAYSALKLGADLAHVFCTEEAGPVIKGYSPELIVHPYLTEDSEKCSVSSSSPKSNSHGDLTGTGPFLELFTPWMEKFGCVVIGPGLGRNTSILKTVREAIIKLNSKGIPIVIDADGLWIINQDPNILSKECTNQCSTIVLTPNAVEYSRLEATLKASSPEEVQDKLGGPVIVCKGREDIIMGAQGCRFSCAEEGSPRRAGGQGDILSGCIATFLAWSRSDNALLPERAAYAGCYIVRRTASLAFAKHRRAMGATDMIAELGHAVSELEEIRQT